jgi:septal ring factor EnvC (AmiA/AmiB activator)
MKANNLQKAYEVIDKYEKQKERKTAKIDELKAEIAEIDSHIAKFKKITKDYEALEKRHAAALGELLSEEVTAKKEEKRKDPEPVSETKSSESGTGSLNDLFKR